MAKVMIDLGHGGVDSGATYNGRKESNDVLRLGLLVGDEISRHGVDVEFTRTNDRTLSLSERSALERKSGANCLLSIHRNAYVPEKAKGVETFHYPSSSNGKRLAASIQSNIVNAGLATENRGVKTANFHMLRETKSPSALVEVGFIDSAQDNTLFDNRLNDYAKVIAKGILEYLGLSYKEPEVPKPTPAPSTGTGWRVCVGYYEDYNNAKNAVEKAKNAGFDAYMVEYKK